MNFYFINYIYYLTYFSFTDINQTKHHHTKIKLIEVYSLKL